MDDGIDVRAGSQNFAMDVNLIVSGQGALGPLTIGVNDNDMQIRIKSLEDQILKLNDVVSEMRSDTRAAHFRNFVKDTSELFQLRGDQGSAKNASFAAMLDLFAISGNDKAYFMRTENNVLPDINALGKYIPIEKWHDSLAVLCTKLKMIRDFLQLGVPEVR